MATTQKPAPDDSPVLAIPPPAILRRRLADIAYEVRLLRQLLRLAVRREHTLSAQPGQEGRDG
jgi:hypothetical protein